MGGRLLRGARSVLGKVSVRGVYCSARVLILGLLLALSVASCGPLVVQTTRAGLPPCSGEAPTGVGLSTGRGTNTEAARTAATYRLLSSVAVTVCGSISDVVHYDGALDRHFLRTIDTLVRRTEVRGLRTIEQCAVGDAVRVTVGVSPAEFEALKAEMTGSTGLLLVCAGEGCTEAAGPLSDRLLAVVPEAKALGVRSARPDGGELATMAAEFKLARVLTVTLRGVYLGERYGVHYGRGHFAAQLWNARDRQTVWADVIGEIKDGGPERRRAVGLALEGAAEALAAALAARLPKGPAMACRPGAR